MQLLLHRCPYCAYTALAPMPVLTEGNAGTWQCEICNQAFDIHVEFRPIDAEILDRKREELAGAAEEFSEFDADELDPDSPAEKIERRLFDVRQEIERLRHSIQQLEDEAARLEDEKTSL